MVLILRNATETCPLLEKSALHEPKIFLKMARIARHPPSKKTILLWIVVVAIALILFGVERWIGLASLAHGEFAS
jgi:hypothetical protein